MRSHIAVDFSASRVKPQTGALEVRCPQEVDPLSLDNSVFIAGGIGVGLNNVADWQQQMIHELLADVDVTALNPRRENFPADDPNALLEQIKWEHHALRAAQSVLFWLPAGYSCPITVYELGVWSMRAKPIFVGIDPDYPNRDSLVAQLAVARPNLKVVTNLKDLAQEVREWRVGTARIDLPKPPPAFYPKRVYLNGGISRFPQWQRDLSDSLANENIVIVDPRQRRVDRTKLSGGEVRELARTNHKKLLESEAFCIWFPEESKSPASLYELGVLASMPERPLFVGADPNYFRLRDVVIQTSLVRPEVKVVTSLSDLAEQVRSYYKMR